MSPWLTCLLLAADVDGSAALRHASALAALGPHPFGSPRTRAAAEYVAAEFRQVGLADVRLQEFDARGAHGTNVIGVLRGTAEEMLVLGAHHDSVAEAPGAYDDGGGVGVLIEVARALTGDKARPRTLVFASFDGEEDTHAPGLPGSRAFIESLGSGARRIVAALVVEMCGARAGSPVLQTIAYPDRLRPGATVVTPAWLIAAAQRGARAEGVAMAVGDPLLPWLYQPGVRSFRVRLYADDMAFLQAGHPAVFVTDSSFSSFYPHYHRATDTADKLDPAALERVARGVLGAVRALRDTAPGPDEAAWFAALGFVLGPLPLAVAAVAALVPGLVRAFAAGGPGRAARLVETPLFGLLYWRHPVPALCSFLLPHLFLPSSRRWLQLVSLLPLLALVGLGLAAGWRGMASGVWLAPWELALAAGCLALLFVGTGAGRPPGPRRRVAKRAR